jgi:Domain of unknown function (DUF1707)
MAMRYYAPYPLSGGDPYRPRGPHALRVGDAERDAAAADLGEHYAAGRLTLDELNERLESVFAARTYGQLARVMADLPGPGRLSRFAEQLSPIPDYGWAAAAWAAGGTIGSNGPWAAGVPPTVGYRPRGQRTQRPADRAGRVAALSLLLVAMLIWLFTALLFARQGYYHPAGPFPQGGSGGAGGVSVPGGGPYDGFGQQPFGFGK